MIYNLPAKTPEEHQMHLDILAGSDQEAAMELIKQIEEKVDPMFHINYMYPHTVKVLTT